MLDRHKQKWGTHSVSNSPRMSFWFCGSQVELRCGNRGIGSCQKEDLGFMSSLIGDGWAQHRCNGLSRWLTLTPTSAGSIGWALGVVPQVGTDDMRSTMSTLLIQNISDDLQCSAMELGLTKFLSIVWTELGRKNLSSWTPKSHG